jgi:ABC-type Na+ efflux pump permease subunit
MLRWRKVTTIIRREYFIRVKTKAFWISTVAVPLMMAAFMVLPGLMMSRTGGTYAIAVVTADDGLYSALERAVAERSAPGEGLEGSVDIKPTADAAKAGAIVVRLSRVAPAVDEAAQRRDLKRRVVAKELAAVLVFPTGAIADGKTEFLSTNVSAFRLMNVLEAAVDAAVVHQRLTGAGVAPDRVKALTARADMRPVRIGEDLSESKEGAAEKSFILSYILTFTLYMTMIFYGYYVMRGVLEEKSSRIVEVIVANVRPMELMLGKIFGVGAVGLTQYAIWVIAAMNFAVPGLMGFAAIEGSSALLSPVLLVFFVVFLRARLLPVRLDLRRRRRRLQHRGGGAADADGSQHVDGGTARHDGAGDGQPGLHARGGAVAGAAVRAGAVLRADERADAAGVANRPLPGPAGRQHPRDRPHRRIDLPRRHPDVRQTADGARDRRLDAVVIAAESRCLQHRPPCARVPVRGRPVRLEVRTLASHAGSRGSIPLRAANEHQTQSRVQSRESRARAVGLLPPSPPGALRRALSPTITNALHTALDLPPASQLSTLNSRPVPPCTRYTSSRAYIQASHRVRRDEVRGVAGAGAGSHCAGRAARGDPRACRRA